ncbi:MAG: multifunctional CCA tRNA nucleotidyl transferase/2'3'-cyclic phosphodiesterase/2'nucleotidase/phosphatase [Gammaproteobacteria bacterium]|nr:multifunctional CCA tRNA nucleotidyl transferase/2'3'-cyclic phosphodiesterase/2'nucleotidase/phosphatase [Gammaproteobacteria bacterium]
MKTYLVGGAIRDRLLGLQVHEHDWVVVGATQKQMLELGYRKVGNNFPVFLHPETSEEYALARTEAKTGPGYKGFAVDFSPEITLEEDLQRRDLTINAIAEDPAGGLIDPHGGRHDLEVRLLRHVSPAFIEDPVRVLRVARFQARLAGLNFHIAPETMALMQQIVDSGEIDNLVPERVWQELHKSLLTTQPWRFFETLAQCGATGRILLLTDELLEKCNRALRCASNHSDDPVVRFAAWASPIELTNIKLMCKKLKVPKEYAELAILTHQHGEFFEQSTQLAPPDILQGLKALDAFRRPDRFEQFLLAAEALSRAQPGREQWPHPQREYLHTARLQAAAITAKDLTKVRLEGKALAAELDIHRRAAIGKVKRTYRWAKFR